MKIRKIRCPHCEEVVELDFDVGLKQECPECEVEILISGSKTTVRRRRSGVRIGASVHGTALRENEDGPEEKPKGRKERSKSKQKSKRTETKVQSEEEDWDEEEEFNDLEQDSGGRKSSSRRKRSKTPIVGGLLGILTLLVIFLGARYLQRQSSVGTTTTKKSTIARQETKRKDLSMDQLRAPLDRSPLANLKGSRSNKLGGWGDDDKETVRPDEDSRLTAEQVALGIPKTPSDRSQLAREVLIRYLEASSLDERLPLIRNLSAVSGTISDYYKTEDSGPIAYSDVGLIGVEGADLRFIGLTVKFSGGVTKMVGLEYTADGYKVDWPSFVIYSEMDWDEFMETKPKLDRRFRVLAKKSDYFNYGFNADEYQSYEMTIPYAYGPSIYGYVRLGSSVHDELAKLSAIAPGQKIPLVVDLAFPSSPKTNNMVLIKRLVSNGWMIRAAGSDTIDRVLKGDL